VRFRKWKDACFLSYVEYKPNINACNLILNRLQDIQDREGKRRKLSPSTIIIKIKYKKGIIEFSSMKLWIQTKYTIKYSLKLNVQKEYTIKYIIYSYIYIFVPMYLLIFVTIDFKQWLQDISLCYYNSKYDCFMKYKLNKYICICVDVYT
jgi:hypothetical protein